MYIPSSRRLIVVLVYSLLVCGFAKKYNVRVDFEINVNPPDSEDSSKNITTTTTNQTSVSVIKYNDTSVSLEINIQSSISSVVEDDGEGIPEEDSESYHIEVAGSVEGDFETTLEVGVEDDPESDGDDGIIPKEGLSVPTPTCKTVLLCLPKFIRGIGSKEVCQSILQCDNHNSTSSR